MLVFLTLSAPVQAADKIRISMTGFAGQFMTFPLAQKRGFLKEEGVEAEIVRISAAAGRAALTNGDIDYSTGIGGTAINGALSGIPIRVVACFVPAPVLGLVARPEFKTVQALKGKTIAILIPGGVAHFAARAMVRHVGLDPEKEMKYLAVGPPDARYAALTQGLVEAAILGPPLDFEARKQGYNILVAGRRSDGSPRDRLGHRRQENSMTSPMRSSALFAPASKPIVTFAPIAMARFSS